MTDIVLRLREDARGGMAYHELSDEAADEIERLQASIRPMMLEIDRLQNEIERLRTTNDNLLVEIKLLRLANDRFENRASLEQKP